ncbi:proline-rich protein 2-like [Apodemus sylvaticus]|uniref:proline-rich protein 2-like n=1 Tax=Apodemus sylvaticus TaxID=10129 RepID=UPI0022442F05|nr:proline-rich protein 2-like [Apodemus sylvaticus]
MGPQRGGPPPPSSSPLYPFPGLWAPPQGFVPKQNLREPSPRGPSRDPPPLPSPSTSSSTHRAPGAPLLRRPSSYRPPSGTPPPACPRPQKAPLPTVRCLRPLPRHGTLFGLGSPPRSRGGDGGSNGGGGPSRSSSGGGGGSGSSAARAPPRRPPEPHAPPARPAAGLLPPKTTTNPPPLPGHDPLESTSAGPAVHSSRPL